MGALARPDIPPGPQRELNDALHQLHHHAGWPSLRTLARHAGCSPTTVSAAFSTPRLPSWGLLELLVEAMGGDASHFHQLWLTASNGHASTVPSTPPIAGRRTELVAVRRHLETGTGLLLVTGEAGIGKTRLVSTAAGLTSCYVARAHGLPLLAREPFSLVADVFRQVHAHDDGQWFKEALAECAAFVGPSLSRILPDIEQDYPADGEDRLSTSRLFAAVSAALGSLAALRPLVLLLEDLHWADASSLTCLERWLGENHPLSVVGTFRPGASPEADEWFSRVRVHATDCLTLAPLTRDETAEQVALLTGATPRHETLDRIHGLSQGLPLFTEELARTKPGDPLPDRLLESLARPLEGLGRAAHRVLAVAAVANRPLAARLVAEAAGATVPELTDALRELDRRRLLSTPYGTDVGLRHPLLAVAARSRLVPGEAAQVHARLGAVLAATPGASAAEVAEHWRAAGDAAEERRWRVAAGRTACRRLARSEEAAHWERLLALWPAGASELTDAGMTRAELLLEAVHAFIGAGRMDEGRPLVDEALALAPGMTAELRALALRRASQVFNDVDSAAAVRLAEEAVEANREIRDLSGVVQALGDKSCALRTAGRFAEADAVVAQAVRVSAELGDPRLHRYVLIEQAWHEVVAGRRAAGLRNADEATRIRVEGDPFADTWLGVYHSDLLLVLGADSSRVEAAVRQGLESARSAGIESFILSTTMVSNVVEALLRDGLTGRAAAVIDPRTSDEPRFATRFLHLARSWVDVARGETDEATRRLDAVSRFDFGPIGHRQGLLWSRASCALWSGRAEQALAELVDAFVVEQPVSWSPYTGSTLVLAARAAAETGARDPSRVEALLSSVRAMPGSLSGDPFATTAPNAAAAATRATWEAELDRLTRTETVTGWNRAVGSWDSLGRPHDAAYCRWRAAQVALREDQATVATRLLRRAARDAREHVPLSAAIAETAAYAGRS